MFVSGGILVERKNKPIVFEFTNFPPTAGEISPIVVVERKNKPIAFEFTNCPPIASQVTGSCLSLAVL